MKRIPLTVLLALLTLQAWAQTGLHIQEYIGSPYVYSEDSIYVSFSHGTMSKMALVNPTTKAWKYINATDYLADIGEMTMKNPLEGVMLSAGNAARTTDGWQTVTLETTGMDFQQIAHSGAGYVAYNEIFSDLYFSQDGTNWVMAFDGSSNPSPLLSASGNKVVMATGSTLNYVSNDGGQNWTLETFNGTFVGSTMLEFVLISPDTFVLATDQNVYRSYDGGANWTGNALATAVGRRIAIKNVNEFFMDDQATGGYYTADGGATWQPRGALEDKILAFAGDDLLLWPESKSTDNGLTWSYFLPAVSLTDNLDIHFRGNKGLIGIWDGKFLTTEDQGRSFARELPVTGTGQDIMAVWIMDNGDFLAGDRNGQIFRSTDEGLTWTQGNLNGIPNNPYKFSISDDENTVVVSCSGQPAFSTDHGQTFAIVSMGGGSHVNTVKPSGQIIDVQSWFDFQLFQDKGWQVFSVTPVGDKTLIDSFIAPNEVLVEVFMLSDNIGYILSSEKTTKQTRIYKTTNGFSGGMSLVGTIDPIVPGIANYEGGQTRIQAFGMDTLMLIGDGNTQYHYSYDGGATWSASGVDVHTTYPTYYPSLRRGYFFTPSTFLFSLSNTGLYLNTSGTTGPVAIQEPEVELQPSGGLKVYPNPARDKFSLGYPTHSKVDITVYNAAGTVMKRIQRVNTADAIDVSNFPSGVYLVRVQDDKGKCTYAKLMKE